MVAPPDWRDCGQAELGHGIRHAKRVAYPPDQQHFREVGAGGLRLRSQKPRVSSSSRLRR
jgi:hypothetical protein